MDVMITINGKRHYVPSQTTVFEACSEAEVYIPHFCYHPKLSIAANCRMCLVEIAKAPKPVPACATIVTDGMEIYTSSPAARAAQQGVMEFLLINHPLDCPICDQGGECQLQDLAVGYGSSCTRYGETKRVVVEKQLGPLITTVMTRCIHCTRCVRFGQEIAGEMELGMSGRGEHSEIMPFLETTVDSELSGNMIDICPVGALNSKPFRFSARTWELKRFEGVAHHDSWGSMLTIQTKDDLIKRVLPREYEEINECWISDRDRFAYTGIDVPSRSTVPQIVPPGSSKLKQVEWIEALEYSANIIEQTVAEHGADQVGLFLAPNLVSEEGLIAAELMRKLGSSNIDCRLRQQDFRLDNKRSGLPWLGSSIEELEDYGHLLLVGSNPAHELPLLPVRLRRYIKENRNKVSAIGARSLHKQLTLTHEIVCKPSSIIDELTLLCKAALSDGKLPNWINWKSKDAEPTEQHKQLIKDLKNADNPGILIGEQVVYSADYSIYYRLIALLGKLLEANYGLLSTSCNKVGLNLVGAVPNHGFLLVDVDKPGLNVDEMLSKKLKAYILIGCEPLDFACPQLATEAFKEAKVVCIGSYVDTAKEYADVFLPTAVFAERRGAIVTLEGHAVTMNAAVNPPGESRPTWKILRVLANMLGLEGFDYENLDEIREQLIQAGDYALKLSNEIALSDDDKVIEPKTLHKTEGFERVLETAHYAIDQIVRRAQPLQDTVIAKRSNMVLLNPDDLEQLNVIEGDEVLVSTGDTEIRVEVGVDNSLAKGCVRAPLSSEVFAKLDNHINLEIKKAPAIEHEEQKAA